MLSRVSAQQRCTSARACLSLWSPRVLQQSPDRVPLCRGPPCSTGCRPPMGTSTSRASARAATPWASPAAPATSSPSSSERLAPTSRCPASNSQPARLVHCSIEMHWQQQAQDAMAQGKALAWTVLVCSLWGRLPSLISAHSSQPSRRPSPSCVQSAGDNQPMADNAKWWLNTGAGKDGLHNAVNGVFWWAWNANSGGNLSAACVKAAGAFPAAKQQPLHSALLPLTPCTEHLGMVAAHLPQ